MLPVAILFSMAMIMLLWRGDPKRRRIAGQRGSSDGSSTRRLIFAAALLPGVLLATKGDSAAFLIWLGSCVITGWLITHLPGRNPTDN